MKLLEKNLIIPKTKGNNILADQKKMFSWIDSDFRNYGADQPSEDTKSIKVNVFELDEDRTFSEIFTDPKQQCLTQSQILSFIKNHKDKLRNDGRFTFFLFKSYGNFFVARAYFGGSGRLELGVSWLSIDSVWLASYQPRVVVPATNFKILDTNPLDTADGLNERVLKLESQVEKLLKVIMSQD